VTRAIGVIGSGAELEDEVEMLAEKVGSDIALNHCVLVCGGLGGVMEAACKGAKREGGVTLGIVPSTHRQDANAYVDIVVPSGMGYTRNSLVVLSSEAVIAISGSTGTLSEIAMALNYGKPVVCVSGSGGVAESVHHLTDDERIRKVRFSSADKAVDVALSLIRE